MTALDTVAKRVSRGEDLRVSDARAVLESYDLVAIGMLGDEVRRRMHGTRTTFVRVLEVHVDAIPASPPPSVSAGEVRIVGRGVTVDAALSAARAARSLAGAVPVTGFSVRDLVTLAPDAGRQRDLFRRLKDAGLDAIAELAVDDSGDSADPVEAARAAGLTVARLTVENATAVTESSDRGASSPDLQMASIERARTLQESVGGFRVFAPLPRVTSLAAPTTGFDDLKQIALARLVLTTIDSIQVDWALYGPKLAQVGLTVGADDVDNVAASDPGTLGPRRSPIEEIRGNIRAAALEAVERDGLFRMIEGER